MNLFPRPKPQTSCNSCTLLPVDAAYAYDYLAILYVKKDAGLPVTNEIERIETFLNRFTYDRLAEGIGKLRSFWGGEELLFGSDCFHGIRSSISSCVL